MSSDSSWPLIAADQWLQHHQRITQARYRSASTTKSKAREYRRPQGTPALGPAQYAAGGYEAANGRYVINESLHTLTYHIDGALDRALIGKDFPRARDIHPTPQPAERAATWECQQARVE